MGRYNITVVIPTLNPDENLLATVEELEAAGFDDIVIVNDGSEEKYYDFFPDPEVHTTCTILSHRKNRGKGAALKTAFRYFLKYRPDSDGVVTIDSDGQHLLKDIIACTEKMAKTGRLVLGCRDFSGKNVPARSRFGNRTTSFVLKLFCGISVSDTQTGLRAIPAKYIEDLLTVSGTRYEFETNMLIELKNLGIKFTEVPISTVYIDNNSASHFRPVVDSLRVYRRLLSFAASSMISMVIEVIIFYLACRFFFSGSHQVLYATILSRVLSSVVNFGVNRYSVFGKNAKMGRTLIRYICLAIPLLLASSGSIKGIAYLLGAESAIAKTLIKLVVDTILFLVSFRIQQNWVFSNSKKHKDDVVMSQHRKKLTAGTVVRRTLGCIGSGLLYIIIAVVLAVTIVANGPSTTLRDALVLSAKQASATKWVPDLFMDDDLVEKIVSDSLVENKLTIDIDSYTNKDEGADDEFANAVDGLKYIETRYTNFKAYIMLTKDPSRVYVGASQPSIEAFRNASEGMRIKYMAEKENCIACINGGEFLDEGGVGTGFRPIGLTYSGGKCVWDDGSNKTFIGIDNNNRLVVSEGMQRSQADSLGIRDGVSFQNGNVLIDNDESGVHIHYKENNTAASQRTAIGQRKDGTFIMIVTDGRTASSLGATPNEVIDILVSYGAVTAGLLDGGSSAMMYYEKFYEKYGIDAASLDKYQKEWYLCNRYKAFTDPRRIPTYFCIKRVAE